MDKNLYLDIREKLGASLVEWTLSSETEFIEAEKENKELINVAKKRGIVIPSQDLAIFKTRYCEIDKPNGNGVIVVKEAAEQGLKSAVGQQVNLNHQGFHQIVGWILDAKIEDNFVVIYSALFKTTMGGYFETVKEMFADKKLFVSFELHTMDIEGNFVAERREDGIIQVNRMLVSGCGLLIKMDGEKTAPAPACPKAQVLKLLASDKNLQESERIVNKIFTKEDEILYAELFMENQKCANCGNCKHDNKVIVKEKNTKLEIWECPFCKAEIGEKELYQDGSKWFHRPCKDKGEIILPSKQIDGKEEIVDKDINNPELEVIEADYEGGEIEEAKKLTTEQRNALPDSDFALIQEKDGKKIRRFPINDEAHVRNALARLPQAKDITEEERKETLKKILKRAKKFNMTEIVEKYKAELDAMIASGEIAVESSEEEKPIKIVSYYVCENIETLGEDGARDYSSKRYERIVRIYKDGREEIEIREGNSVDEGKITKYTQAQLDEKVAAAKAEVEAIIPTKVKEAEDRVKAEKDVEIAAIKTDVEQKEKQSKEQSDNLITARDTEIASLKVEIDKGKKELEIKKFTDEDIQKAKDDTAKIVARRIILGDVNKEIEEKDLLDDKEFEIRKLRKENEDLKASKEKNKPDFIVGHSTEENEIGGTLAKLVNSYCQGKSE